MTARVAVLHVALDKNYRVDDLQVLTSAILQMKGVITVTYDDVSESDIFLAEARVRMELQRKLLEVIYPKG